MERNQVEKFSIEKDAASYIRNFRDEARFIEACRKCPNYGASWGCPPFDFDVCEFLSKYTKVRIFAYKITPPESGMPLAATQTLIKPERMEMEAELLALEKELGGRAFSYIGKCLHCDGPCRRIAGKPCLHPDKVRPSLESFGFDIGMTLSELFGLELKWGTDGKMPEYLLLVGAVFY